MGFDSELDKALGELIAQWNIAEKRIKKAEQVRAGEVVASAIFELRYAGRKIVDSIELVLKYDLSTNPEIREKVHAFLADAKEDCVKSKHDAIDAMLDFVIRWFHKNEREIGLDGIVQFFPNYLEVTAKITEIQDKIAASRENRNALRDGVYDED